jgi:hypothetical protein
MAVSLACESALSGMVSSEGFLVPKKVGRTYLRPNTGTEMPSKERFQHAPVGACVERRPLMRISQFRVGQQPKLREISFGFWLLDSSVSSVTGGA